VRVFLGVGGVDLDRREPELREEVLAKLRDADWVGVRDSLTLAHLTAAGIAARLMPDPAVLTAELFGGGIRERAESGEVAAVRAAFPQGYLAVQFSAALGDDARSRASPPDWRRQGGASSSSAPGRRPGMTIWKRIGVRRRACPVRGCSSRWRSGTSAPSLRPAPASPAAACMGASWRRPSASWEEMLKTVFGHT
jgi:hypothetical protein